MTLFFGKRKELTLFGSFCPFREKVLEMEFHLLRQWLPICPKLRLSILAEENDRFCARHPPFLVPTHLEQLAQPTAIREGKHGERRTVKNPSVQTLIVKDEFVPALCCFCEPLQSGAQ